MTESVKPKKGEGQIALMSARRAIERDITRTQGQIKALEGQIAERRTYLKALKAGQSAMAKALKL